MTIQRQLANLSFALGLVLGSTTAAAAPVVPRDASPAERSDNIAGIGTVGILLAVLITAGVIAVIASDDSNNPVSP